MNAFIKTNEQERKTDFTRTASFGNPDPLIDYTAIS